jgi:hypothetical protein
VLQIGVGVRRSVVHFTRFCWKEWPGEEEEAGVEGEGEEEEWMKINGLMI